MSERNTAVAGVLIASIFIGCAYDRTIGHDAQALTPPQPRAGAIDHSMPNLSSERANKGSRGQPIRTGAPRRRHYLHRASWGPFPSSSRIVGGCAASWTMIART
jgi:hypothetical protein